MKEEETMGLMVMVSPVLWTSDHVGKIGTIEFTDFPNDRIWVRFEDEEVDFFSSKTLFILKTADELNELAETNRPFFGITQLNICNPLPYFKHPDWTVT